MSEEKRKVGAPVMGVREWAVGEDGSLHSTGVPGEWKLKEAQHARCLSTGDVALLMDHYRWIVMTSHYVRDPKDKKRLEEMRQKIREAENGGHPAPHTGCGCGLYAFYDRETCEEYGDGVAKENGVRGVVSAWGKIIRSEYGFKAEHMRLEAIIQEDKNLKRDFWTAHATAGPAYKALANKHGVPLIKPEEVSAFVQLSGGTVLEPDPVPEPSPQELAEQEAARMRAQFGGNVAAYRQIQAFADGVRVGPWRATNNASGQVDVARQVAQKSAVRPQRPPSAMMDPTGLFQLMVPVLVVLIVLYALLSMGG